MKIKAACGWFNCIQVVDTWILPKNWRTVFCCFCWLWRLQRGCCKLLEARGQRKELCGYMKYLPRETGQTPDGPGWNCGNIEIYRWAGCLPLLCSALYNRQAVKHEIIVVFPNLSARSATVRDYKQICRSRPGNARQQQQNTRQL